MILLLWFVNFAISWANAWGCGKTWSESKHAGGVPHFLNWCGAVMSASGFTWCYLVVLGGLSTVITTTGDDGLSHPLLSPAAAEAFANLGYLIVVFPILGSGLAITVHSWGVFWRQKNLANGAVAGWNSFAQVYNMASALENVPAAARGVSSFFKSDSDDDAGDKIKLLVIALAAIAAIGGILTTRAILLTTARHTAFERRVRYEPYEPA